MERAIVLEGDRFSQTILDFRKDMEQNKTNKCNICGADMWIDDDLHWSWCTRGRCPNAFDQDESKSNEYNDALARKHYLEETSDL